ncbi:MAG: hypothetical protein ACTHNB_00345 [Gaiellaceae bacterium]
MADARIVRRADDQSMAKCDMCGAPLEERGYQVIVWGLGAFDSVECAEKAMRRRRRTRGDDLNDALTRAASHMQPHAGAPRPRIRQD